MIIINIYIQYVSNIHIYIDIFLLLINSARCSPDWSHRPGGRPSDGARPCAADRLHAARVAGDPCATERIQWEGAEKNPKNSVQNEGNTIIAIGKYRKTIGKW